MSIASSFIPARLLLEDIGFWPADLVEFDGGMSVLDRIGVRDVHIMETGGQTIARFAAVFEDELVLKLPGLEGAALVFGSDGMNTVITIEADLREPKAFRLGNVSVALRFSPSVLKPVRQTNGRFELDPSRQHVQIGLTGTFIVGEEGVRIEGLNELQLKPCMIANSGIVIEASSVLLDLSRDSSIPEAEVIGLPPSWMGVFIQEAAIHLSPELTSALPGGLSFRNCFIGTGGFSGEVKFDSAFAGKLFGLEFSLEHFSLAFVQNALIRSEIRGTINLPFFDQPIGLDLSLGMNEELSAALSKVQPQGVTENNGIVEFEKQGLVKAQIHGLAFKVGPDIAEFTLSGKIRPLVGDPVLKWPEFDVKALTIDNKGKVKVEGGWVDLPESKPFNFYGFKLELAKVGFGTDEDSTGDIWNWIGLNGGIHLAPGMPMGASVEGLRISWNPKKFDLVEVSTAMPDFSNISAI